MIITFEDLPRPKRRKVKGELVTEVQHLELEEELRRTRDTLRETIEELKSAHTLIKHLEQDLAQAQAAEKALQDLVCSLVERQDRVNAGIALDIHVMQEDIGILQDQVYKLKTMKGGAAAAAGEKK